MCMISFSWRSSQSSVESRAETTNTLACIYIVDDDMFFYYYYSALSPSYHRPTDVCLYQCVEQIDDWTTSFLQPNKHTEFGACFHRFMIYLFIYLFLP